MMDEFPKALPVSSRGEWYQGWPLIPWLAAKTSKCRIGMSITDTPYPRGSSPPSSPRWTTFPTDG
jgi:FMNH2-dependent dimethyl sulfone monooxygenase